MEPKNSSLRDDFPIERGDFQVPCWFSGSRLIFALGFSRQRQLLKFFESDVFLALAMLALSIIERSFFASSTFNHKVRK